MLPRNQVVMLIRRLEILFSL